MIQDRLFPVCKWHFWSWFKHLCSALARSETHSGVGVGCKLLCEALKAVSAWKAAAHKHVCVFWLCRSWTSGSPPGELCPPDEFQSEIGHTCLNPGRHRGSVWELWWTEPSRRDRQVLRRRGNHGSTPTQENKSGGPPSPSHVCFKRCLWFLKSGWKHTNGPIVD